MVGNLLQTKLYAPKIRPVLIPRPHLIEKLNQSLQLNHKLTLITAPAGFGKTTLVSAWAHQNNKSFAWLSLEESDNDLHRFLIYLVATIQTVDDNIGESALVALQASGNANIEGFLTTLLNEINESLIDIVLILDDYHTIESAPIDNALIFLIEHLPPQMHLVIATREDPNLPLARLRVRGQLTELRATDLRFTNPEAAGFLNQAMGLNLSPGEISALENRTEGWIAGLQMAALSMQGRTDTVRFIQAFTGSHRFVLDYLVEEVLQRQSERIRNFLLQTSILERLSGSLCGLLGVKGRFPTLRDLPERKTSDKLLITQIISN